MLFQAARRRFTVRFKSRSRYGLIHVLYTSSSSLFIRADDIYIYGIYVYIFVRSTAWHPRKQTESRSLLSGAVADNVMWQWYNIAGKKKKRRKHTDRLAANKKNDAKKKCLGQYWFWFYFQFKLEMGCPHCPLIFFQLFPILCLFCIQNSWIMVVAIIGCIISNKYVSTDKLFNYFFIAWFWIFF